MGAAIHANFNVMSGPERRFPASDWFPLSPMTSAQQWGQALLGRSATQIVHVPASCSLQDARGLWRRKHPRASQASQACAGTQLQNPCLHLRTPKEGDPPGKPREFRAKLERAARCASPSRV